MTQKSLRILLAEDESGEMASSLRLLYPENKSELELTVVASVMTLFPTIAVVDPEVILLDLGLTHPEPLETVRRVHRVAPDVPLIVFGGAKDKDYAALSLREGALDYLTKGFLDPKTIQYALRNALERNTLGALADLLRDPVTGLYVRDGFQTLGTRAMETAKEKHSTLVLLCARVKKLQEIQAEFGEKAAESLLEETVKLLRGSFRRTDIVARIGESQFAALAVDAIEPSGPVLRQRLEKRLAILNRDIGPWGPLELQMSTGFWFPKRTLSFPEFLDSVEAGLRSDAGVRQGEPEPQDVVPRQSGR